jgi:hypothetical protein
MSKQQLPLRLKAPQGTGKFPAAPKMASVIPGSFYYINKF